MSKNRDFHLSFSPTGILTEIGVDGETWIPKRVYDELTRENAALRDSLNVVRQTVLAETSQ